MTDYSKKYYCDFCGSLLKTKWHKPSRWWSNVARRDTIEHILPCEKCETIIFNNQKMRVYKGTLTKVI